MIFISYRKEDTQTVVDLLAEKLRQHFGDEAVFKDDADIRAGELWPQTLSEQLLSREVLLAVIGDKWLFAHDAHGRRRIDNEQDWVRREICTALDAGKRVVIVLANNASMPTAEALPAGCRLQDLPNLQHLSLRSGRDSGGDVRRIIEELERMGCKPTSTRAGPPFVLPQSEIPYFTGREDELRQLEELLLKPDGPRVVGIAGLTGTGGMGKSALAFHFANIHRERFPDGVIGLRVDGSEIDTLAQRFAYHAGVEINPERGLSAAEIMQTVFRQRRVLLIFDNAEDADVQFLRPGGERCAVIITTRNRGLLRNFGVPASGQVDLQRFTLSESRDFLKKILAPQRVADEMEAVKEIHDLLGGLPLALRIVGGTLVDQSFTSLTSYAEMLSDEKTRLSYLRDADDPDLNVRASFELSLRFLDAQQIESFACLSACAQEGFSLQTAQVVSEQDEASARHTLGRLVRLSLVNEGGTEDRFVLHPLLFLFSRELAQARGLLTPAEQRHTDYFREYVFKHQGRSPALLDALGRELDALLLTAQRLSVPNATDFDFYFLLEPFLQARGYWAEALNLVERFLAVARAVQDFYVITHLLLQQGQFLQLQGKFASAERRLLESERAAEQIHEKRQQQRSLAMVWNSLGGVYQREGNFDKAADALDRSYKLRIALDDERGQAMVLNSLGGVYVRQGKYNDAVQAFQQCYTISEKINDTFTLAMVLNSLGGVYRRQGKYGEAVNVLQQSYDLRLTLDDRYGQALVLTTLGRVYQQQGEYDQAVSALQRSAAIEKSLGNERGLAMVLHSLGSVYQQQGKYGDSLKVFQESGAILVKLSDKRGQAMVWTSMGKALIEQRRPEDALEKLVHSFAIDESLKNVPGLRIVTPSLVHALTVLGRRGDAESYCERALAVAPDDRRLLNIREQLRRGRPASLQTLRRIGYIKLLRRNLSGYRYGFITPADGSEDIYFGENAVAEDLLSQLSEGMPVTAEVEQTVRGPRARQVRQRE
jgi:tetratricopeptide (TPR) repeat protein